MTDRQPPERIWVERHDHGLFMTDEEMFADGQYDVPEAVTKYVRADLVNNKFADYRGVLTWAYQKLEACGIGSNNMQSALMMDQMKLLLPEENPLPPAPEK